MAVQPCMEGISIKKKLDSSNIKYKFWVTLTFLKQGNNGDMIKTRNCQISMQQDENGV